MQKVSKPRASLVCLLAALALSTACAGSSRDANHPHTATAERVPAVNETIAAFRAKDPGIDRLLAQSAGYVVVPTVGEGAYVVGGGYGVGEAFEAGAYAGRVTVTDLSVGAQVGGQSYSQLVFFEDADDFQRLKDDTFEFGAEVTAIAVERGAAKNAAFEDGVAAFILPKRGLMASASVSGQHLSLEAAE